MKNYIPTINISSLIKNNFNTTRSQQTIKKIEKACIEVGFFQVVGHGINIKKINDVCKIGNKFFNSSKANKNKLEDIFQKNGIKKIKIYTEDIFQIL